LFLRWARSSGKPCCYNLLSALPPEIVVRLTALQHLE
jgi:hypothetical protein